MRERNTQARDRLWKRFQVQARSNTAILTLLIYDLSLPKLYQRPRSSLHPWLVRRKFPWSNFQAFPKISSGRDGSLDTLTRAPDSVPTIPGLSTSGGSIRKSTNNTRNSGFERLSRYSKLAVVWVSQSFSASLSYRMSARVISFQARDWEHATRASPTCCAAWLCCVLSRITGLAWRIVVHVGIKARFCWTVWSLAAWIDRDRSSIGNQNERRGRNNNKHQKQQLSYHTFRSELLRWSLGSTAERLFPNLEDSLSATVFFFFWNNHRSCAGQAWGLVPLLW